MRSFLGRLAWEERGAGGRSMIIGAVIAAGIFIGGYAVTQGGGGGGITAADIWVDVSGGSCVDHGNGVPGAVAYGNDGTECGDLPAAYAAAEAGDIIGIKGGTYTGDWVLAFRSDLSFLATKCDPYGKFGTASSANCVRVSVYQGDSVELTGKMELHGSSIWLNGTTSSSDMTNWRTRTFSINVDGFSSVEGDSVSNYPDSVTIEGLNTSAMGTYSSQYVYLLDVDVGPQTLTNPECLSAQPENRIGSNGASGVTPRDIRWERVAIHDQNRTQGAADVDCHIGGLQFWASIGVTLAHVVFEKNAVYNIDVGEFGFGPDPGTIDSSSFACPVVSLYQGSGCDGQRSIQFQAPQFDESRTTISNNVTADGTNGTYGCDIPPWSTCAPTTSNNTEQAESTTAPAVP